MADRGEPRAPLAEEKQALVDLLIRQRRLGRGAAAPMTHTRDREAPLPLSYAQERLWFLDQLEPESPAYNISAAVRLTGRLDVDGLRHSLSEVVRRHEALRTTFVVTGGEPAQVVGPASEVPVEVVALRSPAVGREVEALAREEARRPFDLARGPLLRARLLQVGPEEHVLLLTLHHIVCDAWSMAVFTQEVAALYQAYARGAPPPLAELPVQYADYACWQREWLRGEVLEGHLRYWREQLRDAPLLALPTDRPRPAVQRFEGASLPVEVPATLTSALKRLSHQEGVTLFMALLAAFAALLRHRSGQDDVVVGTDVANRTRAETEPLIGFFVNQLPLRVPLGGNPSFREVLSRVKEVALAAYEHQDLPFNLLVQALKPERTPDSSPLFRVKLVLQNVPMSARDLPGLVVTPLRFDPGVAQLDLIMNLADGDDGLKGVLEYNIDLLDGAVARAIAEQMSRLLEKVVARPESTLGDLDEMLAVADKQQRIADQRQREEQNRRRLVTSKRARVSPSLTSGERPRG
jgi:Condensation domain